MQMVQMMFCSRFRWRWRFRYSLCFLFDDTIAWYENDGAANPTWAAADIATNADGAQDV